MKKQKSVLIIAAALVLLLAAAGMGYSALSGQVEMPGLAGQVSDKEDDAPVRETDSPAEAVEEEEKGYAAPDFTVLDAEGNEVKLSDCFGTPLVVNFWASWCGPCKSEMPDFNEAAAEYEGEVRFLMVNLTDGYQETMEKAEEFIEAQGYTFPVYYDTQYSAAAAYGVSAIPMTIFIDEEGNLVTYAQGAIDGELLRTGIGMILSE